MIWTIANKEILAHIMTFRFTIGTILFLVLVSLFTSVLIGEYEQKLEEYNARVSKNGTELRQLMTYQNLKPTVYKSPEILSIFSKGIEESIGKSARVSIGEVPFAKGIAVSGENPLLSIFPAFDIVLIFKFVICMFILIFVYDAISGEKEDKTLGMMLSNSIPRHQVLLGKFTGGIITISITILMGFLVGGILLASSPAVNLSSSEWFRIVLMFFASLILAGVFYSLGLFISSITKRASTSLMILLFIWILYVLVIPDLSIYIASNLESVESREKINFQIQEIWNEYEIKRKEFQDNLPKGNTSTSDEMEPWGYFRIYATKSTIVKDKMLNKVFEPLSIEYAERAWQVEKSYLESLKIQKDFSNILNRFSPVSLYENLMSGFAGSDIPSAERFFEQARAYRRQIIDYFYSINAFSLTRYTSTIKDEDIDNLYNYKNEDLSSAQEGYDKYVEMRDEYTREKPVPLNTEVIPSFRFRRENTVQTIKRILPDAALLSIMGVIFFLCAFVAFLKYDVR